MHRLLAYAGKCVFDLRERGRTPSAIIWMAATARIAVLIFVLSFIAFPSKRRYFKPQQHAPAFFDVRCVF
jgi:hypothetical protein